ncbi:MAG: hypothetical protein R6U96_14845 [Promethearchaeia archaeon]
MRKENLRWTIKLDWSNIVSLIGLDSLSEIPEDKRMDALESITERFGTRQLLNFDPPEELDELVAEELKKLMKKELNEKHKKAKRMKKKFKGRMVPMKNGGIFKFNINDFKDLDLDPNQDPKDLIRSLYKKLMTDADEDDDGDDDDKDSQVREDRTGYYI